MTDSLRLKLKISDNRVKFISLAQRTKENLQRCIDNLLKADERQNFRVVLQDGENYFALDADSDVACLKGDEVLALIPKDTNNIQISPLHEHRTQTAPAGQDPVLQVEIQKLDRPRLKYPQYNEIKTYKTSELLNLTHEQRKEFMETLRAHGYIYLDLAPDEYDQVQKCAKESSEFFSQPVDYKTPFTIEGNRRTWGYKWLPSLRKEYVKVRKTTHQKWHSNAYKDTCYETYDKLNALTVRCMRVICEYLGLNDESFAQLIRNEPPYAVQYEYATSFLEIFHYLDNPKEFDVVPCPDHVDVGLITIIPRASTAGLEMYDWVTGDWHPVERDSSSTQCVLLVGETLSRLSNKYFSPTVHRVALEKNSKDRNSMIYEILPYPFYTIDCSQLNAEVVGPVREDCERVLHSYEYIQDISNGRVSVNKEYPAMK